MARKFQVGDHVRYGSARKQTGTIVGFQFVGMNDVTAIIASDKISVKENPHILVSKLAKLN